MTDDFVVVDSFGEMLWPDPRRGPWSVRGNFVTIDGRPECVGLVIWRGATQDPRNPLRYRPLSPRSVQPIRATDVQRGLRPVAALIDRLRRDAAEGHGRTGGRTHRPLPAHDLDERLLPRAWRPSTAPARPGAPRRYDYGHFVEVAETYLQAWEVDGVPPTQAVADHFGVSRSTAAKWVARARSSELRLLSPTRPRDRGRAGARPGRALLRLRERHAAQRADP